jgi:hypothetical protein
MAIRVGDRFKSPAGMILEVIGTLPGGKIQLIDRENVRFTDRYHRDVKTWKRIDSKEEN